MSVRSYRLSVRSLRWSVRSAFGASVLLVVLVACAGAAGPTNDGPGPTSDSPGPTIDSSGPPSELQSGPTPAQPKFDGARAWAHLQRQVQIGPRPSGSPALTQTRQFILGELKSAGIQAREQAFEASTPAGPIRMVNVIATIPGTRADRVAIASHYDTKRTPFAGGSSGRQVTRFVGASDSASSTAALIELGRALQARRNDYTIELIFFDGEEAVREWAGTDNTYGSRYYVQTAQKDGSLRTLKALVLLDMIGDRNLNIKRETTSTVWLTDIVWASARRLGYVREFINEPFTIGGDDHFPFLEAGIPAIDIIDFDYSHWHEATDDLPNVSQRSLQVVGEVVLDAIPAIERRLTNGR